MPVAEQTMAGICVLKIMTESGIVGKSLRNRFQSINQSFSLFTAEGPDVV